MRIHLRGTTHPSYYTTKTTTPRNIHPPLATDELKARKKRIVLEEKPSSPAAWAILNPLRILKLRKLHHNKQRDEFQRHKAFRKGLRSFLKGLPVHPPLSKEELATRQAEYQKGITAEANLCQLYHKNKGKRQ